ncbi:MAG: hypothetical protein Ta2G_10100 [Termitinemataceae bacterium]|nr:MAG: hypothetical protein Ta2G_10100 [Termitinemataceae bacterium]
MKKLSFVLFLMGMIALPSFALPTKLDDVLKSLDANCKKYQWGHITKNVQTMDDRKEKCDLQILTYDGGIIWILSVIKKGNRYDVRVEFVKEKEPNAIRAADILGSVRNNIQNIIPEAEKVSASE